MSEPRISTGVTRNHTCAKCDAAVTQRESVGAYGSGPIWIADRHQAPCGAYCWGAGVPPKDYRTKQLHGFDEYPCPRCS